MDAKSEGPPVERRPWDRLEELAFAGSGPAIAKFLEELPAGEAARALSRVDGEIRVRTFSLLGPKESAWLLDRVSSAQAAEMIEELPTAKAAAILQEMPSHARADMLGILGESEAEAILEDLDPADASDARELLEFDPKTAGGMMVRELLAYSDEWNVEHVLDDLRAHRDVYSDYDVQYTYIVDRARRLRGVLRMRDLVLAKPHQPVRSIMIADPTRVRVDASLEEVTGLFREHRFAGVPVVDRGGRLLGVVRRSAVEAARADRANKDFLKVSGLSGEEEFRSMPVRVRSRRRLSWLSINIVLNLFAAAIIAAYESTLQAAIALAVFLPIISDMSGCSGNQAVAVSLRELTLGLIRPFELLHVLRKEITIGIMNGLVLGVLLGAIAFVWKGNPWLGLVVGVALALNTVVAVTFGGVIPLILRRFGMDAALSSSPILTTVTDMCGFFFVLGIATLLLQRITG